LRRCRADAIAWSERKRNTKLQAIDVPRHLHCLNPEQRSAVEYGIGGDGKPPPALLTAAGAGTGKTKSLAHRVAHLILNGSDPRPAAAADLYPARCPRNDPPEPADPH
jgi:hypothetical protein